MNTVLRYGTDSTIRLDLEPDVLLAQCDAPRGAPLEDPTAAVKAAVSQPLDFPPLSRARVPGDRIVLAVDHGVPQAAKVVAAVIDALLTSGAEAADITVLSTQTEPGVPAVDLAAELENDARGHVAFQTHDPGDKTHLSYLAANAEGKPIYLNRKLQDADLVIPIGCLRVDAALAYHGVHDALFPTFSDQETLDRFRVGDATGKGGERRRLSEEAEEAAWLLGVLFTVQIVPGPGDSILHVLAGQPAEVFRRGRALCNEAWSYSVPKRASLVIAAIEGSPEQQTWENVARALAAASRAVTDEGTIALCTSLAARPGAGVRKVAAADDRRAAVRRIRKERQPDLLPASELSKALERSKVYLLSRLDEESVEDLGIAPVEDAEEIARLSRRHASCILLANAQHVAATPLDE